MKTPDFPPFLRVVALMTAAVLLTLWIRNLIVPERIQDTLLLNLFHGFVPLFIAWLLQHFYERLSGWLFWLITLVWVLYYPNSPYMISDLKHVGQSPEAVQNYDDLIVFAFAILSAFYGFLSLKIMYRLFRKRRGPRFANLAIWATLLLSCLGFYMGRVLLLFSADFFKHPLEVIKQVWAHLFPVGDNLSTYAIIILFGGVQWMLLIMMKDVNDIEPNRLVSRSE